MLDTFPIVRREDEAACGRYRTRELILTYANALAAGDVETVVTVYILTENAELTLPPPAPTDDISNE